MHDLEVPKSHINLHLARWPQARSSQLSPRDPPSTPPTRHNFFESLTAIERKSRPGDFLLVHFSGHGTRRDTLYKDLKSDTTHDELLCFLDTDIADVELGKRLDELCENGLVVLVTLDCCFSGGATRLGQEFRVRCMPRDKPSVKDTCQAEPQASTPEEDNVPLTASWNVRNASLGRGWLHRERHYNVLAACQEHELAWEHRDPGKRWGGLLTSSLIDCYRELQTCRDPITYSRIQGALEAFVKRKLNKQQPIMIGNPHRVLFGSQISNTYGSTGGHMSTQPCQLICCSHATEWLRSSGTQRSSTLRLVGVRSPFAMKE